VQVQEPNKLCKDTKEIYTGRYYNARERERERERGGGENKTVGGVCVTTSH
jgi:hypothetical protein